MNTLQIGTLIMVLCFFSGFTARSQKDSLSFLALGDSYTVGTSERYAHCWPVQLQRKLGKKNILVKKPTIIAGAGWTSGKLLEQLALKKPAKDYDMVSLQIGVNNQYRKGNIAAFKKEFASLLDSCIAYANNSLEKVFVLSIPDWSVTPFARNRDKTKLAAEIEAYNTIIVEETATRNILFIDVTKASQEARYNTALLARDSLHPSKKMYKAWVRKINTKLAPKFH